MHLIRNVRRSIRNSTARCDSKIASMVTHTHLQLVQAGTGAPGAQPVAAFDEQHETVQRALQFVEPLYKERLLPTGEPLLPHAVNVARTLAELKLDPNAL